MIDPALAGHLCQLVNHGMGEQPDCANYIHKAAGLLTDPAHITGELIFDGFETAVAFALGGLWARRQFRKQHAILDAEHGITHDEATHLQLQRPQNVRERSRGLLRFGRTPAQS